MVIGSRRAAARFTSRDADVAASSDQSKEDFVWQIRHRPRKQHAKPSDARKSTRRVARACGARFARSKKQLLRAIRPLQRQLSNRLNLFWPALARRALSTPIQPAGKFPAWPSASRPWRPPKGRLPGFTPSELMARRSLSVGDRAAIQPSLVDIVSGYRARSILFPDGQHADRQGCASI